MDFAVCAQCGKEIEDKSIVFRKRIFCSDECCEEFEEVFLKKGEPELVDLVVEDVDGFGDDDDLDLGDDDELEDEDELPEDDFDVDADDDF